MRVSIFAIIDVIIIINALYGSAVLAQQESYSTAISSAQNNLQSCYEATKQAEAAGANVNSLIGTLNEAAGLLTKAQLAYASGDYGLADNYASQSQSKLDGFVSQANTLKQNAQNSNVQKLIVTLLSVLCAIAILCLGLIAYVRLNRTGRNDLNGIAAV